MKRILFFIIFLTINVNTYSQGLDSIKEGTFTGKTLIIDGVMYDQQTNKKFSGIIFSSNKIHTRSHYKNGLLQKWEKFWDSGVPWLVLRYRNAPAGLSSDKEYQDGLQESFHRNGQLETRYSLKNKKVIGKYEEFYDNGRIKYIQPYQNNARNGFVKYFSDQGVLLQEIQYKKGLPNGSYKEFSKTGELKIKANIVPCNYEHEMFKSLTDEDMDAVKQLDGYDFASTYCSDTDPGRENWDLFRDLMSFTQYIAYTKDGTITKDITFFNTQHDWGAHILGVDTPYFKLGSQWWDEKTIDFSGEIKFYDRNGFIHRVFNFKQGNLHGPILNYSDSTFGSNYVESKGSYENGKQDGVWENYSEFIGEPLYLHLRDTYKDGKLHGLWEAYYPDGSLDARGMFKDGKEDGEWIEYHDNGLVKNRSFYVNGKYEGLYEWFHDNGNIRTRQYCQNGDCGIKKKFDRDGILINEE